MNGMPSTDSDEMKSWQPEKELPAISLNQARYGKGFLVARPEVWFPEFENHWISLFHTLGLNVESVEILQSFEFPESLSRITSFEVDGELGALAMSAEAQALMSATLVDSSSSTGSQFVLEYFERRFLSSLFLSACPELKVPCYYISGELSRAVEVSGVVELRLGVNGREVSIWVGVGPRLLDRMDALWRQAVIARMDEISIGGNADSYRIDFELAELAVPPALLIDYVRGGTIVDLNIPVTRVVNICANGERWAQAELCQFHGKYAARIVGLSPIPQTHAPGTTKVRIAIANVEFDREAFAESAQAGSILLSATPLSSTVTLMVSGEEVAQAQLVNKAGKFAATILSR